MCSVMKKQSEMESEMESEVESEMEGGGPHLEEGHQVGLWRRLELRLQPAGELLRFDLGILLGSRGDNEFYTLR